MRTSAVVLDAVLVGVGVGGLSLLGCAKSGPGAPAAPSLAPTAAAPSAEFAQTSLPNGVSGMVSHWAFPKSQSGGLAVSSPFVFVGG